MPVTARAPIERLVSWEKESEEAETKVTPQEVLNELENGTEAEGEEVKLCINFVKYKINLYVDKLTASRLE